jgi:hypothetical protein
VPADADTESNKEAARTNTVFILISIFVGLTYTKVGRYIIKPVTFL